MLNLKDRREEPRFPLSDVYRKYVSCRLYEGDSDCFEAQILDFSMKGLKILSPVYKKLDSEVDCIISLPKLYPKDLRTKIRVRYVGPADDEGNYILGAMIIDADRSYVARVFTKIIEFVTSRTGSIY
jgi:hypothetical protein